MPNQNDGTPRDGRAPGGDDFFVEPAFAKCPNLHEINSRTGFSALRTLQGQSWRKHRRRKDFKSLCYACDKIP